MPKKCAFRVIVFVLALVVTSISMAGARQQVERHRGDVADAGGGVRAPEISRFDRASGPVHRFLEDRLRLRLLRLAIEMLEIDREPSTPGFATHGLTDDPDPTGEGADEDDPGGDEEIWDYDTTGGAEDSEGSQANSLSFRPHGD